MYFKFSVDSHLFWLLLHNQLIQKCNSLKETFLLFMILWVRNMGRAQPIPMASGGMAGAGGSTSKVVSALTHLELWGFWPSLGCLHSHIWSYDAPDSHSPPAVSGALFLWLGLLNVWLPQDSPAFYKAAQGSKNKNSKTKSEPGSRFLITQLQNSDKFHLSSKSPKGENCTLPLNENILKEFVAF